MKIRDLIAALMLIKEEDLDVLESTVFFHVKGEDNLVEINSVSYDADGDVTFSEDMPPDGEVDLEEDAEPEAAAQEPTEAKTDN